MYKLTITWEGGEKFDLELLRSISFTLNDSTIITDKERWEETVSTARKELLKYLSSEPGYCACGKGMGALEQMWGVCRDCK